MWHEIFAGDWGFYIFCLVETNFAPRTHWFSRCGIKDFCDFQKVPSTQLDNIFVLVKYVQSGCKTNAYRP